MPIVIGEGDYRYEVIENWGRLPDGWRYGEVAAVGVDSKDNVYVFSRSAHPMTVFDREGCSAGRTVCTSRRTIRCIAPTTAITRSGG